jgi:hypothetical protein
MKVRPRITDSKDIAGTILLLCLVRRMAVQCLSQKYKGMDLGKA